MPSKTIDEILEDLKKKKELEKKKEFDKTLGILHNSYYHSVAQTPPLSLTGSVTTTTGTSITGASTFTTYSGMANPNFVWTEPIRFGFTIRFKTTKAKLTLDWKEHDYTQGTPIISNELKKLL